jgi:hypothetical protein
MIKNRLKAYRFNPFLYKSQTVAQVHKFIQDLKPLAA